MYRKFTDLNLLTYSSMSSHYCPYMRLKSSNEKTNSASIAQINVARTPTILIATKESPIKEQLVILGYPGKFSCAPTKLTIAIGFQNHGEFESTWKRASVPALSHSCSVGATQLPFAFRVVPFFLSQLLTLLEKGIEIQAQDLLCK